MSPKHTQITESLGQYIAQNWLRENAILKALREETAQMPEARMQIAADQGQLMALLVKMLGAQRIVEVGTFTGYSALVMAQAMPDTGEIVCCDVSEHWTAIARKYWQQAGVEQKITLKIGPALETLQALLSAYAEPFDMAFIDADKENYGQYYELCLRLLKPGGVILLDNVFWGGSVVDDSDQTPDTQAIREINARIHADNRVDIAIVPIGDGLSVVRKK